jgi:hypothetical protein
LWVLGLLECAMTPSKNSIFINKSVAQ